MMGESSPLYAGDAVVEAAIERCADGLSTAARIEFVRARRCGLLVVDSTDRTLEDAWARACAYLRCPDIRVHVRSDRVLVEVDVAPARKELPASVVAYLTHVLGSTSLEHKVTPAYAFALVRDRVEAAPVGRLFAQVAHFVS